MIIFNYNNIVGIYIIYKELMGNNKSKVSIITWEDPEKIEKHLKISRNNIEKFRKKTDENLSKVLKEAKNKDREKTPMEKLLIQIFGNNKTLLESTDNVIEKIGTLLKCPMNTLQRSMLINFFIKNPNTIKKISSFTEFFEKNGLLYCLSFSSLLKIFSLDLTIKELKNLLRLGNSWCQVDIMINDVLETMNDKIILSDDITNKVIQLNEMKSRYDGDSDDIPSIDLWAKDYILLKDIRLSQQLINKIQILIKTNVIVSIQDLKDLDKYEIDEITFDKLIKLKNKVGISFGNLPMIHKMKIDENLIKKIDILNKLWLRLYSRDLPEIQELTKNDIKKIEYINKLLWEDINYIDWLQFVVKLKDTEIDKIVLDIKKLWLHNVTYGCFEIFYDISEPVLQYCIKNNINNMSDIKKIKVMYSLSDKIHMRNYISRKNEYLENNRTLSEEKYKEYFWWKWKFDKHEINQWDIWLCYLYSWLEILKKTNWFAELMQTNFIEKSDVAD